MMRVQGFFQASLPVVRQGIRTVLPVAQSAIARAGAVLKRPEVIALGVTAAAFWVVKSGAARVEAAIREQAVESFGEATQLYGWKRVLSALSQEEAFDAYCKYGDTLPFKEAVEFYREAEREAPGRFASPLCWSKKFYAEIEGLRCDEIVEAYPMEELFEMQFFFSDHRKVLEQALQAVRERDRDLAALERVFRQKTPQEHREFDDARELAELKFKSNPVHVEFARAGLDMTICGLVGGNLAASFGQAAWEFLKTRTKMAAFGLALAVPVVFQQAVTLPRILATREVAQGVLQAAKDLRDKKISLAQEVLRKKTAGVRKNMEPLFAESRARFEQKIEEIQKKWDRFKI